ncbi:unnamed protein product [Caretta caretta]
MELLEALDPKTSKHIPYDVQANLSNPYNQEVEEGEILPFPILGLATLIINESKRLMPIALNEGRRRRQNSIIDAGPLPGGFI